MTPKLQITALLKNDTMKFIRYSRLFSRNIKQTGRRHILRVFLVITVIYTLKKPGYNTSQIPLYLAFLERISNTTFWLRLWPLVRNSAHSWARQCTESWGCQFFSIRKQRTGKHSDSAWRTPTKSLSGNFLHWDVPHNQAEQEGINGNWERDTVTLIYDDNTSFPRELSTYGTVWTRLQ